MQPYGFSNTAERVLGRQAFVVHEHYTHMTHPSSHESNRLLQDSGMIGAVTGTLWCACAMHGRLRRICHSGACG